MTNPKNTAYAVKRLIGRKYSSDEVKWARTLVPYAIVEADNGDAHVEFQGRKYSPPRSRRCCCARSRSSPRSSSGGDLAGDHHRAGVLRRQPAPGHQGRRNHRRARVVRIINEPTAASLAYGSARTPTR